MSDVWEFTNDPADPCSYCVQWEEPDPELVPWDGCEARPYWPDGSTAPRIYRGVHAACQRAVATYVAEAAGL